MHTATKGETMIRSTVRTAMVLFVCVLLGACNGNGSHDEKSKEVVRGFTGGCTDGMILYVQDQFQPYGAQARDDVLDKGSSGPVVHANKRLISTGWYDTKEAMYPDNPKGIRGIVWYYVPKLKAWVTDAAARSKMTHHAPGNESRFFTNKLRPPRPSACELKRSSG